MPLNKEETQKVFDALQGFIGENRWTGREDRYDSGGTPYGLDSNGMQPQNVERAWRQTELSAMRGSDSFSTKENVRNPRDGSVSLKVTLHKPIILSEADKNFFIRDGVIISKEVFDKALAERFPAPPAPPPPAPSPVSREAAIIDVEAFCTASHNNGLTQNMIDTFKQSTSIDAEGKDGMSALGHAMKNTQSDSVKLLLDNGAKCDDKALSIFYNSREYKYKPDGPNDPIQIHPAAGRIAKILQEKGIQFIPPGQSASAAPKQQPQPKILNASVAAAASSPSLAARVAPSKEKEKEKKEEKTGFITKLKNRFGGGGSST